MKIKQFAIMATLMGLTACGGGEVTVDPDTSGGTGGGANDDSLYAWDIDAGDIRSEKSSMNPSTAEYAHQFTNVGILDPYGEVLGTISPELPADAIFTGTGVVDVFGVTDETAVYNLTGGDARVVLSGSSVDVTLNGFTFQSLGDEVASPIASISVTGSEVGSAGCGNAVFFCGGEFEIKRSDNSSILLNSSATQELEGAFFGQDGAEAGGYVLINQDQKLNLNAAFIADSQ